MDTISPKKVFPKPLSLSIISAVSCVFRCSNLGGIVLCACRIEGNDEAGTPGNLAR